MLEPEALFEVVHSEPDNIYWSTTHDQRPENAKSQRIVDFVYKAISDIANATRWAIPGSGSIIAPQ